MSENGKEKCCFNTIEGVVNSAFLTVCIFHLIIVLYKLSRLYCGGMSVGFGLGCRREWMRGSREIVIAAGNQVISGNCLIRRLQ